MSRWGDLQLPAMLTAMSDQSRHYRTLAATEGSEADFVI